MDGQYITEEIIADLSDVLHDVIAVYFQMKGITKVIVQKTKSSTEITFPDGSIYTFTKPQVPHKHDYSEPDLLGRYFPQL